MPLSRPDVDTMFGADSQRRTLPPVPFAIRELVARLLTGLDRRGQAAPIHIVATRSTAPFQYRSGVSGTPELPPGAEVKSVAFAGGTLTIDGGDAISGDFACDFAGMLLDPVLVFDETTQFYVEFVVEET